METSIASLKTDSSMRLKPTYEEWKQSPATAALSANCAFKAYLWGMETNYYHLKFRMVFGLKPTYEEWKLNTFICINCYHVV